MQRANTRKKSETKGQTSKLCEEKTIAKGKTKNKREKLLAKGQHEEKSEEKGKHQNFGGRIFSQKWKTKGQREKSIAKDQLQGKNQKQRANIKNLEGENFRTMESKTGPSMSVNFEGKRLSQRGKQKVKREKLIAKGQHKEKIRDKGANIETL